MQNNEDKQEEDNLEENWKEKELHGRYPATLMQHINKDTSLIWLKLGYLFPETEAS